MSVIGDNMIPGELASYEVKVSNPLWGPSSAGTRTSLTLAVSLLLPLLCALLMAM